MREFRFELSRFGFAVRFGTVSQDGGFPTISSRPAADSTPPPLAPDEPIGVATAETLFKDIAENDAAGDRIERSFFPSNLAQHIERLGLAPEQIGTLIGADKLAAGRNFIGSDAALLNRCVRIGWLARETFGSPDKAAHWFNRPTQALLGKRPYELLASESGGRMLENLLHSIGHGIAA